MGIVDTSNVNWIASHSVDAETASQFAAILNEYRSPVSTRNYALAPAAPAPAYLNAEQAAKYQALVSSQGNDWGWQSLPQQLLTTVLDRISVNADGSVNFDRLKGIPIGDYTVDMPAGASIQPLTLYYNSETGQYYVYTESGDSGYSSVFNTPAGGKILTQTVDYGWDAGIATTYTYIPGAQLLAEAASQQAVVDQLNALAAQTPVAPASFSADEAAKFDALVRGYGYSYAQMDTPYLKSLVDALSFRADGSLDFSRASGGLLGLGFTVPPDGAVLRDGSQIYQMQTVTTGGESEYTYQQRVDYLQGATIGADGTVSKNGVVLGHVSQQTSVIAAHNELIDYGEGGGHWEWVPETTITQTFFTASSAGVFVRDTLPANGLVALDIGDGNLRMGDDGRPDNAAYLYFNPLVGLVTPSANLHQDSDWFEAAFAVVFAVVVACIAPELIGVIGEALGASAATISTVTIAAETSGAISAAVTYAETGSITDAANAFSTGVVTGAVSAGVAAAVAPYAAELVSTMTDTTTAVGGTGITLGGVSSPATALATDASTLNGFLTNTISQGVANTVVNGGDFEQGFASALYSSAGQFVAGNVNDYLPDAITGNKAAVKIVDSAISSGVTSLLSGESSDPANALIGMAAGALVQNVMAPSNSSSISLVEPGATVRLGGESSPDPASPYSLTAGQTVRLGGDTPVATPTDSTSTSAPSGGAALDNGAGSSPAPSTTPTDAGSTSPSGSVGDGAGWGGFFGAVNAGGANYLDPLAFSPPAASLFSDAGGALLGGMAGAAGNSAPNIGLAGDVTSDDASSGENSASAPKAPSPVAISGDASLNANVASLQASLNATPTQNLNIPQIGDAAVTPNPDAGNAPRVYAVNMVTVKPGDTLWSLTNGSVAQIGYVSMTNGLNGSSLRAGDTINLGNFDPSSMTPAQLRAYESYGQAILNADNARLESLRQAALQAAAANANQGIPSIPFMSGAPEPGSFGALAQPGPASSGMGAAAPAKLSGTEFLWKSTVEAARSAPDLIKQTVTTSVTNLARGAENLAGNSAATAINWVYSALGGKGTPYVVDSGYWAGVASGPAGDRTNPGTGDGTFPVGSFSVWRPDPSVSSLPGFADGQQSAGSLVTLGSGYLLGGAPGLGRLGGALTVEAAPAYVAPRVAAAVDSEALGSLSAARSVDASLTGMSVRDVIAQADKIGLATQRDQLVLWNKIGPNGVEISTEWALQNGGKTLEMTPGGQWLMNANLASRFTSEQQYAIWKGVSELAVQQASGQIRVLTGRIDLIGVYPSIERPTAITNPAVIGIDPMPLAPRFP